MKKIIVNDLKYRYPTSEKYALNGLSFSVEEGELCAIIGPNGAGKTSICNAIRGFIPHFYKGEISGGVVIDDQSVGELSLGELSLKVGFMFQNPFTQMSGIAETVFEELAFGLENMGVEPEKIKMRVHNVMELTGIETLENSNPFELSGGQQQKVALASMIVMDTNIMILDEPTSQLDPKSTEEIFNIIRMQKESGKTIVLVEHKMELVAEYADHVILVDRGQVVMDGNVRDVLTSEVVLEHGTSLPQYSILGIEMEKNGYYLSSIPYTLENAKKELSSIIRQCQ